MILNQDTLGLIKIRAQYFNPAHIVEIAPKRETDFEVFVIGRVDPYSFSCPSVTSRDQEVKQFTTQWGLLLRK